MSSDNQNIGIGSFLDRFHITRRFEENLELFLEDHGIHIMPLGHNTILFGNRKLDAQLRKLNSKRSTSALMMKFTPDFIMHDIKNNLLYFMDAKASITPVFFNSHVKRIAKHAGDSTLLRKDIGEIEREAWYSYNTFYPGNEIAIIIASPYTPKLILAEWVKNIRCLWCYKGFENNKPVSWDCNKCPIKVKSQNFGVVVNEFAGGSGTPHTNLDLRSFRSLPDFLKEEFNIEVKNDGYKFTMTDFVKLWPLGKPAGKISWGQFNGAVKELRENGCDWIKFRFKDDLFESYQEYIEKWRDERNQNHQ